MSETLSQVLVAGLRGLRLSEPSTRELLDELVRAGSLSRAESAEVLAELANADGDPPARRSELEELEARVARLERARRQSRESRSGRELRRSRARRPPEPAADDGDDGEP